VGIIVEKRRSIWERLTRRGKISADDALAKIIEQILSSDTAIGGVHREE